MTTRGAQRTPDDELWPGWSAVGVDWLVRNGIDTAIEHDRHGYWRRVEQTEVDD